MRYRVPLNPHSRYGAIAFAVILHCFLAPSVSAGVLNKNEDTPQAGRACDAYLTIPTHGYGADGTFSYQKETLRNEHFLRKPVTVFLPEITEKAPVIFFAHAFGASDWESAYPKLMQNLASRGAIVVFVPYRTLMLSEESSYETLWDGFQSAVKAFGSRMDLSRVAFVGHSFGGGATPYLAYKGLVENGWGKNGSFMFIMAPWYSFLVTPEMLSGYPANTRLVMQIYDEDDVNDYRMAIDIFDAIDIPRDRKIFLTVQSQVHKGCAIRAQHGTPSQYPSLNGRNQPVSSYLHRLGVYRFIDLLMAAMFNGETEGIDILFSDSAEIDMGHWNDGTRFAPVLKTREPKTSTPEDVFKFPWDGEHNPRAEPKGVN